MAIHSPLLDTSIEGAGHVLVNVCGGPDMGILEFEEVTDAITAMAAPDAEIIVGTSFDETLEDELVVTVIATTFRDENEKSVSNVKAPGKKPVVTAPEPIRPQPIPVQQPTQPVEPEQPSFLKPRAAENVDMPIDIPDFLRKKD